jgi:integrase
MSMGNARFRAPYPCAGRSRLRYWIASTRCDVVMAASSARSAIATVQAMLGHASPATTARYDRRGERAVRQAANRVQVPYVGIA